MYSREQLWKFFESIIFNPSRACPIHMWDPVLVITVPADVLALYDGKPSAGTIMITKRDLYFHILLAIMISEYLLMKSLIISDVASRNLAAL